MGISDGNCSNPYIIPTMGIMKIFLWVTGNMSNTGTGFGKRGLPHTSNLLTLVIHNCRMEATNALKYGQQ